MFVKFIIFVLLHSSSAVIYQLNESDYALMPPVYHLDNYEECFQDPEDLYCTADFALVSDEPSSLLTMIQEFSAHSTSHYNHTLLRYGICIKQSCEKFYNETGRDLGLILEACVNETLYDTYKLRSRISNGFDCSKLEKDFPIEDIDIVVAVICLTIVMINVFGSLCDYYLGIDKSRGALKYLYCFSIFRNWSKLISAPHKGRESRQKSLTGLHGIRTLNIMLVIVGHACYSGLILTESTKYLEGMTKDRLFSIIVNGTIIMQTCFIMSSFLLVYNCMIHSEKRKPSWVTLPMQFLRRWLRLTPSLAIVLALTATWFGRISRGPYWKNFVYTEVADCRRDWWKHLLYINNYFYDSYCMGHTWYLAADTQLYWIACIVFLLCETAHIRKVVLSLLFVVGMLIPVLHTYFQNLDGILIVNPESALKTFIDNPTYNEVYKKAHTNLVPCIIGMVIGYLVYYWQKGGGDPKIFHKYRYFYWSLFLVSTLCCFSCSIFYQDQPPLPLYVHLLFAALLKPIFCIAIGGIILGVVLQFEGLYRPILEWPVWTVLSRLSFSAYLLHIVFLRNIVGMQTSVQRTTMLVIFLNACKMILGAFITALFLWMLVETPFANLVDTFFATPQKQDKKDENENKDSTNKKLDNETETRPSRTEDASVMIKMRTRI